MIELVGLVLVFWVVPTWVAHVIGSKAGRDFGFLWGALLGWIGVLLLVFFGEPREMRRRREEWEAARDGGEDEPADDEPVDVLEDRVRALEGQLALRRRVEDLERELLEERSRPG